MLYHCGALYMLLRLPCTSDILAVHDHTICRLCQYMRASLVARPTFCLRFQHRAQAWTMRSAMLGSQVILGGIAIAHTPTQRQGRFRLYFMRWCGMGSDMLRCPYRLLQRWGTANAEVLHHSFRRPAGHSFAYTVYVGGPRYEVTQKTGSTRRIYADGSQRPTWYSWPTTAMSNRSCCTICTCHGSKNTSLISCHLHK